MVRMEGLCQSKIPMTPSGINPATSQACRAVPQPTAPPRALGSTFFYHGTTAPSGPSPPHY